MKNWVVVDVESDGGLLGVNSMVCFGAVALTDKLDKTFYAQTAPISKKYNKEALSISGFTREEHEKFNQPLTAMKNFKLWLNNNIKGQPVLVSDNNGYDSAWINYYFLTYIGSNPFGWSSRRIGDMFCGFYKDSFYKWKKHRTTSHDHNPINDAKSNAEALLYLKSQGFK